MESDSFAVTWGPGPCQLFSPWRLTGKWQDGLLATPLKAIILG